MTNLPDVPNAEAPRPEAVPPPPPPQKPCRKCESLINEGTKKCSVCGALQTNVKPCRICAELISFEANYCNGCKSYQGKFRYVSFSQTMVALLAAVLSLLVALAPHINALFNRQSDTSFTVTGADANAIYIHVMNSGRKPSIIRECSLTAAGFPKAVMLDFLHADTHDAKNVIRPSSEETVGLTSTGLSTLPADNALVTLQITVEESFGVRVKQERFPAKRIREFFAKKPEGIL